MGLWNRKKVLGLRGNNGMRGGVVGKPGKRRSHFRGLGWGGNCHGTKQRNKTKQWVEKGGGMLKTSKKNLGGKRRFNKQKLKKSGH